MRTLLSLLVLVLFGTSCQSLQRLERVSPLSSEVAEDRVNLWPLFYKNGEQVAVLWPLYDQDEQGFALRPLVTKDGNDWEVLPPIAWWNTESGDWVFVPAYSLGDSTGVFPIAGFGDFSFVGPIWWEKGSGEAVDSFGLFPLATLSPELSWVTLAWWDRNPNGEVDSYGLFPLATKGQHFKQIGPVFWGETADGDSDFLLAFPLFGYMKTTDGGGFLLSLLGGRGWDEDGDPRWVNVLGPLYHHSEGDGEESTHVLWPLVNWAEDERESSWSLWPVVGHTEGKPTEEHDAYGESWALAGLYSTATTEQLDRWRLAPLFSYLVPEAEFGRDFLDWVSLVQYRDRGEGTSSLTLGTPLVFNYHDDGEGNSWNALLGMLDYESDGSDSSFDLLYYLYRQQTTGDETRRDLFPFITWDTRADGTEFSFLWRLFHYESDSNGTSGHVLFIPWG